MVISVQYVPNEDDTFLIVQDMFDQDKIYLNEKIIFANRVFPEYSVMELKFINEREIWIEYKSRANEIKNQKFYIY